jgi:hypothetical protein
MNEKSQDAKAGAPKKLKAASARSAGAVRPGRPTAAQLDEREWHKAGPRRQAGPPLAGGAPAAAAEPHSAHQPPPPTDPKG